MNINKNDITLTRKIHVCQSAPKVAILILNWNSWKNTIGCLESVRGLKYANFLAVIVDNGSQDGSLDEIKKWIRHHYSAPFVCVEYEQEKALHGGHWRNERRLMAAPSRRKIVLIRNEENLGYDGGNNVAIRYALESPFKADYVFILNNDAAVEQDCLKAMVDVAEYQNAGIVGALIVDKQSQRIQFAKSESFLRQFVTLKSDDRLPKNKKRNFWRSPRVCGAGMLIRKDVLLKIHRIRGEYLNSDLFAYHDELDFCYIASKAGFKTVMARKAIVYHKSKESQYSFRKSLFFHYYLTRNPVLLVNGLLPLHQKILFHVLYFPLVLWRTTKKIMLHKNGEARAILLGFIDGYKGVKGKWKYHDAQGFKN